MTTVDITSSNALSETTKPVRSHLVPRSIKLSWGTGALGVALLMNAIGSLALFYMVGILKIEPVLAGGLIFVTKLFDVATDPIVGSWTDRIKSDKSRRRPFLFAGAIVSSLSFAMIFSTPVFGNQSFTAAYILVALLIYAFGYTLFNIPYMSMPSEMTPNYHERSSIHSFRMVFVALGGLLAGAGAPLLLEKMGRTEWSSYATLGCIGGIIIFAAMMTAWAGTSKAQFTTSQKETPKIMAELGHVFTNKHFIRLIFVKLTQLLGVASSQAAMIFFILNALQRDLTVLTYYGITLSIVAIIASPIAVRISKVIGKKYTYLIGSTFFVITVASWMLAGAGEPIWAICLRAGGTAVAMSFNVIMAMSMLTDIINHDSDQNGVRREGVFTAFYSFAEKFTFAFGPLIVGVALSVAGFNKNLPAEAMQSPEIRHAVLLGVSYLPAVMGILSLVILWGYKLDDEMEKGSVK